MKILKITAIALLMTGSFSSCLTKADSEYYEPIEIPVMEYSLQETGCWWTNKKHEKVFLINSNEEFKKYIECTDNACIYPSIDFSKHTLLLTNGVAYNGVAEINSIFLKVGSNKYTWNVTIRLNAAQVIEKWSTAILVTKLTNKATIVKYVQQ